MAFSQKLDLIVLKKVQVQKSLLNEFQFSSTVDLNVFKPSSRVLKASSKVDQYCIWFSWRDIPKHGCLLFNLTTVFSWNRILVGQLFCQYSTNEYGLLKTPGFVLNGVGLKTYVLECPLS